MKSKKAYILAILFMFFLTLSCAYANEDTVAENALLSSDVDQADLSSQIDNELEVSEISDDNSALSNSETNSENSVLSNSESVDESILSSPSPSNFNYDDLVIKDINFTGDSATLNIQGFSQNGLEMSDFVMTIIPIADSFNLNMKIPEVKYNNNNTMFIFKNLDLNILPSSNPSALNFSAVMDRLDLITGDEYVYLQNLNLLFESYPEVNGVSLAIDIANFVYGNLGADDTHLALKNLDFDMALGLNGEMMNMKILLPAMNLISGNDTIDLTDLDLSILMPSLKMEDLDVSVLMSKFKYTNTNGVSLDLNDLDLSLVPDLNSTDFNSVIKMSSFIFSGINSSDLQFPGFNIQGLDFENFTTGLDLSNVDLSGVVSIMDVSKMDLSELVSYLGSGFNIVTYTDNMPGQYESSLDFNAVDLASMGLSDIDVSSIDMAAIFKSGNYSSLSSSVLNITQLFDAFDIDMSDLGVDLSGYNLSAITISDISSIISDPNFNMSAITSKMNLSDLDLNGVDISGLIKSFNLTSFDLNGILKMFNITGFNLTDFMNGFDLQKLLNLFMKNNTQPDDNKTVPDKPSDVPKKPSNVPKKSSNAAAPSYVPASYEQAKETYDYRTYSVTRLSDNAVICNARFFILEYLNMLFNMNFINGHLKVYIDGVLVFEGNTTDNLTMVIFELTEKYLGEHEIKVEFTDSENKTKTYTEKIIVN